MPNLSSYYYHIPKHFKTFYNTNTRICVHLSFHMHFNCILIKNFKEGSSLICCACDFCLNYNDSAGLKPWEKVLAYNPKSHEPTRKQKNYYSLLTVTHSLWSAILWEPNSAVRSLWKQYKRKFSHFLHLDAVLGFLLLQWSTRTPKQFGSEWVFSLPFYIAVDVQKGRKKSNRAG